MQSELRLYCRDWQDKRCLYRRSYNCFQYTPPHFLWWNKWEKDVDTDPFIDMDVITPSMRSELECALKENDVAFEVNIDNICTKYGNITESFADQYLSYVKELQDKGIKLSFATDLHADKVLDRYECAEKLFDKYQIDPEKFWKL